MGVYYWLHHLNAFLQNSEDDEDDMDELLQECHLLQEEAIMYGDNWKIKH